MPAEKSFIEGLLLYVVYQEILRQKAGDKCATLRFFVTRRGDRKP
jgi:hypothetical protein